MCQVNLQSGRVQRVLERVTTLFDSGIYRECHRVLHLREDAGSEQGLLLMIHNICFWKMLVFYLCFTNDQLKDPRRQKIISNASELDHLSEPLGVVCWVYLEGIAIILVLDTTLFTFFRWM